MNKKLNKWLRLVCIIALWSVLIVASFRAYNLYQYNKLHPQNEYSWNPLYGPPQEFIIKSEMMNETKNIILWGILIAVIWEGLLYFNDPKKHFLTYCYRKLKPIMKKIESEDDEFDK